ncbi:MAG: bifunctional metallophosphatase/5'-nucleotidase [Erysipelotrichaceae bacterium]|nr:bifunctional metallophosphatase/5'-nucleotidase [Erysipelotrichaceae bacterium]
MKIKILATSDVHGYLSPYSYSNRQLCAQGLSRLSGHISSLRDEHTLLIDNGDSLQGSSLNYYHNLYEKQQMQPMAKALNYLEYDYYNLGNHDFNYGPDMLHRYMKDVDAVCLTGNAYEYGNPLGKEVVIHRFDDNHAIALIGVVTQHIPVWEAAENIEHNEFENAFDYVRRTVEKIKATEKVNGICVVYHGGHEKHMETNEPTELLTSENLGWKMCHEIEGIDVLICGHQHRSYATFCNGVATLQPLENGKELGVVNWDLDTHEITVELLKADQKPDEKMLMLIEEEEKRAQEWLDQPLGRLKEGDLLVKDPTDARIHKHPVISFINQVQLSLADKATLSSQALFNESVGFNSSITMRDLVSTYVYSNTLKALKMTGKVLKEYLEKSAEYFDAENGQVVVARNFYDPKPLHFNYEMVDGLDYTIKSSNPIGSRIVEMTYQGKPVKETDEFVMVMSSYRANGGGEYDMVKNLEVVQDIQKDMVDALAEYILAHPILEVDHKDNITVIA